MKSRRYLSALVLTAVLGADSSALAEIDRENRFRPLSPVATVPYPGPTLPTARQCAQLKSVGFKTVEFRPGRTMKLWYPTSGKETLVATHEKLKSSVVVNGLLSQCNFPLVVFSHGFHGCSGQSLFVTEALAKAGYIVAAPDHLDADCSSTTAGLPAEIPLSQPELWNSETYTDRRDDMKAVLDLLLSSAYPNFANPSRVGAVGHSLGGYTAMGVSGAWSDWLDPRFKAALLLSPYAAPFLASNTVGGLQVPTMYQGGTLDFGVTPYVKKAGGVYDKSPSPKYFMELKKATHFAWTNAICGKETKIVKCLARSSNARLILSYGIGFLNEYVAGKPAKILKKKNSKLSDYRYDLGLPGSVVR